MCYANNEKQKKKKTNNNKTTKPRKNWTLREKENYNNLGILEVDATKQVEIKEKKLKQRISWDRENFSNANARVWISWKGINS